MSCLACSDKGWWDVQTLAGTMLRSVCWSSASTRRDMARHCLYMRMSGGIIPLTTGSMKGLVGVDLVGVDRMHPDTSRKLLFRVAVVISH